MNSGFQAGSMDTHIIEIVKFFIFANTSDIMIIRPHLRSTFLNFVKNVFYKHALEFQVEYYFASDFRKVLLDFTPLLGTGHV